STWQTSSVSMVTLWLCSRVRQAPMASVSTPRAKSDPARRFHEAGLANLKENVTARLLADDPQAQDRPAKGFRSLEVIDIDSGFDNGLDLHESLLWGRSICPPSPRTSSSTISPDAPLHGHSSMRYCNSFRILVRASCLVGAVT